MTEQTVPVRKLSYPVMLSYGFGQVAEALTTLGFSLFLLFYYNQVLKVSGTITGIALAASLAIDALIDPLAGAYSDKLRSRWGRRHPLMMFSAVPLIGAFFFMFNPPAGMSELGLAIWLIVFALLTRIGMTFFQVPHLALGAEMAYDYNQRSAMYSFNIFFASLATALGYGLAYYFFFPTTEQYNPGILNPHGYLGFSIGFGVVMLISIAVTVFGTWREIPHLPESGRAGDRFTFGQAFVELGEAFRNRSFRALFFGMALATLMLSMEGVLNPYMGPHFWGLTTEDISTIPAASFLGLIVGVTLVPAVTRWLDKKNTLMYCSFIAIVAGNFLVVSRLIEAPWMPANDSPWVLRLIYIVTFIGAVLGPLIFGSLNAMFADIVDEHELDTGHRREGIIFAARAFLIKLISSMGVVLGGIVIDWIEFPRGATMGTVDSDIVWTLGLLQMPLPSILVFGAVILYSGYRLDRTRHAEILQQLAARRSGAVQ